MYQPPRLKRWAAGGGDDETVSARSMGGLGDVTETTLRTLRLDDKRCDFVAIVNLIHMSLP
jgi:hypothetical protein